VKKHLRLVVDTPFGLNDQELGSEKLMADMEDELRRLAVRRSKNFNALAELERRSMSGELDNPEVYVRVKSQLTTESRWIADRIQDTEHKRTNLSRTHEAVETVQDLSERLLGKLDTFEDAEWRDLLINLGGIFHIDETDIMLPEYRGMIFSLCLELPLGKDNIADTVFTTA